MSDDSFVDEALLARVKTWRNYLAAKVGFRNHWYAAFYSRELGEGEFLARVILGEDVLFRRVGGKVHAVKNRCIHRGVRFSEKPECHTPGTITCWYHGFTYRWEDGVLCNVIGAPQSQLIGKRRIKVYPVEEALGMVFVFIGDADARQPPLQSDVPPTFFDAGRVLEGESRVVEANWRSGPEGGLDEIHRYLHRDSRLLLNTKATMPLGHVGVRAQCEVVEPEDGPKGIIDHFNAGAMYFEADIEDAKGIVTGVRFADTSGTPKPRRTVSASVWLPAVLRVQGFPAPDLTFFEFYTPINETQHRCFLAITRVCETEEERASFRADFVTRWRRYAIEDFLSQDISARESTQWFYRHDRAWLEEVLVEDDFMLMEWRRLASRHARGIQKPSQMD
jgi:carbazole 1,9a-dioxygenase terminal dioxygenase component